MADDKKEGEKKPSPLETFREKLADRAALAQSLQDGLKSTNAKVRALAAKMALKTQDNKFIKTNVLPLINSEKTKRVLNRISKKIKREDLLKRIADLKKAQPAAKKEEAGGEAKT